MGRRERKNKIPIEQRPVSINVASRLTGVETHTLRYWEKEFAGFLQPMRTPGGQRRYRPQDIQVILEIKRLLKEEMYSIAGARRVLELRMKKRRSRHNQKSSTRKSANQSSQRAVAVSSK